jgi:hypothetical protein
MKLKVIPKVALQQLRELREIRSKFVSSAQSSFTPFRMTGFKFVTPE